MADKGQATEQPTQRRVDKARKDGRFPVSREMLAAAQFLTFAILASSCGAAWYAGLRNSLRWLIGRAFTAELTPAEVMHILRVVLLNYLTPLAALGAAVLAVSIGVHFSITGFGLSSKNLTPQFGRLDFFRRIREVPRQNLPMLLQALVLLPVFGMAVYGVVKANLNALTAMPLEGVEQGARHLGRTARLEPPAHGAAQLLVILPDADGHARTLPSGVWPGAVLSGSLRTSR